MEVAVAKLDHASRLLPDNNRVIVAKRSDPIDEFSQTRIDFWIELKDDFVLAKRWPSEKERGAVESSAV